MELITGDVEAFHCGFADFDALLVAARVERAFDLQTGRGGRGPDQFDDGNASCQRPAAPVLRDVAEQPVLDLVPCRWAGRIVVDADHEPGFVGQFLQFELPEAHTGTIRAAAVRRNRQIPVRSSQQRIDCTANSAVSLVIPTLTNPVLVVTSYTP